METMQLVERLLHGATKKEVEALVKTRKAIPYSFGTPAALFASPKFK